MNLEKQQLVIAETLAELLKTTRIKLGLTVTEVAQQLHLKQSFILALESGDYRIIGSMVYVKGYLRIYARILHIDIENDIAALKTDGIAPPVPATTKTAFSSRSRKHLIGLKKRLSQKGRWPLVVLLVVLLSLYAGLSYRSSATKTVTVKVLPTHQALPLPTAVSTDEKKSGVG